MEAGGGRSSVFHMVVHFDAAVSSTLQTPSSKQAFDGLPALYHFTLN